MRGSRGESGIRTHGQLWRDLWSALGRGIREEGAGSACGAAGSGRSKPHRRAGCQCSFTRGFAILRPLPGTDVSPSVGEAFLVLLRACEGMGAEGVVSAGGKKRVQKEK